MVTWRWLLLAIVLSPLLASCAPVSLGQARVPAALAAFAAQDGEAAPSGGVLLLGSSSAHRWVTLTEDVPGVQVVNRGIEGAELGELSAYVDELVAPYDPRLIVLYAGDNDLARGRTPEAVLAAFETLMDALRARLPEVPVLYLSIKPSPVRWGRIAAIRRANALVATYAEAQPGVAFVDVFTPMLDPLGRPRRALYLRDGLHLSRAGYALWAEVLAPYLR